MCVYAQHRLVASSWYYSTPHCRLRTGFKPSLIYQDSRGAPPNGILFVSVGYILGYSRMLWILDSQEDFTHDILYIFSILRLCKGTKEGMTISENSLSVIVYSGNWVTCLVMDPISKQIGQITSKRLPVSYFSRDFLMRVMRLEFKGYVFLCPNWAWFGPHKTTTRRKHCIPATNYRQRVRPLDPGGASSSELSASQRSPTPRLPQPNLAQFCRNWAWIWIHWW